MSVTMKNFKSQFLSLLERQDMKLCVNCWWKKYVILKTVPVKTTLLFFNSVFPSVTFPFIL